MIVAPEKSIPTMVQCYGDEFGTSIKMSFRLGKNGKLTKRVIIGG